MPAMISRIIAAEFSFWWPIHRRAQVEGEIWLKIRFLTVRFRTVGPSGPSRIETSAVMSIPREELHITPGLVTGANH
jgi:hypothetical protein